MAKCDVINTYQPFRWLDDIVMVDPDGSIVYERDDEGNLVQMTNHMGVPMVNPYTGEPIWKVKMLQDGTRFTAERMNQLEQAICSLFAHKDLQAEAIEYIMIILDIEGTVQGGQGNFFDSFDSLTPKDMTWDKRKMIATRPIESEEVITQVDDTSSFKIGDNVFVYDDTNFEKVAVKEVISKTEIKLGQSKVYKKGAFITRSTMLPNRVDSKFDMDSWDTYSTTYTVV